MTYNEALDYIHDTRWRGSKRGLSRIKLLLDKMDNPQDNLRYVHVAGTNGKGSTSACIAQILREAGYKTGLYTSPFIERYNERIQVDGVQIGDDELAELVERMSKIADSLPEHPTEFEFGTAIAFQYFMEKKCDIVVLEVGMGGEFDATNVINNSEVTVFTAIGLDHTEYLGPTVADIARTKGGIIKVNGNVCAYGSGPEADAQIENICKEKNASIKYADFGNIKNLKFSLDGTEFDYGARHIRLSLPGTYQPYNAVLAMTAVDTLVSKGWKIAEKDIISGLAKVYWPGRFEVLSKKPVFILDGAHNPHGIKAAAESIRKLLPGKKMVFVVGIMADKDIDDMLPQIVPLASEFITLTPSNPRAMESSALADKIRELGSKATPFASIEDGVKAAIELAGEDGIVFALGSLYFSSDVRKAAEKVISSVGGK